MKVTIEPRAIAKIMHWVKKAAPNEVSGMGKVMILAGSPHVIDAFMAQQENGPGHTEIDSKAMARLMYETKDMPGHLNFWWHSHGNGMTFFSKTDEDTIQEFGKRGWVIATCFNSKGEHHSGYYFKDPEPLYGRTILETQAKLLTDETKIWDEEYDKNFRVKKWVAPERFGSEHGAVSKLSKRERRRLQRQGLLQPQITNADRWLAAAAARGARDNGELDELAWQNIPDEEASNEEWEAWYANFIAGSEV